MSENSSKTPLLLLYTALLLSLKLLISLLQLVSSLELPLQLPVTTTGTSGLLLWTPMLAVTTAPPASTTAFADTS